MSDPLRRPHDRARSAEDIGDVLASIRRLIAQDGTRGAADAADGAAPVVAPAPDPGDAPRMRPAAEGHAALTQAVEAAAARMADTARRVAAARDAEAAPFRLKPDALIPPAEPAPGVDSRPDARLRLSPSLTVVDGTDPLDAPRAAAGAVDLGPGMAHAQDRTAPQHASVAATPAMPGASPGDAATLGVVALAAVPAAARTADPAPCPDRCAPVAAPAPLAQADTPSAAAPSTATPQEPSHMQIVADRTAPFPRDPEIAQPGAAPAAHAAPLSGPAEGAADPGAMLRALIRETVRTELAGEIGTRLSTELRQIVREEVAGALAELMRQAATR